MGSVIESANFAWLVVSVIGAWYAVKWTRRQEITAHTKEIILAWVLIFGASGLNHGWFAISRHTAPEGLRWNPDMYEFRWLVVLVTSALFCWGMLRFIRLIEGFTLTRKMTMLGIVAVVSFVAGFI